MSTAGPQAVIARPPFELSAGFRARGLGRLRSTKRLAPGAVSIPGGHVDDGETLEDALRRELREELDVASQRTVYVCTLLHRAEEFRKIHYFAVESWQGEIANNEAEALLWIPLDQTTVLDFDVDRIAVNEYVRIYGRCH